MGSWKVAFRVLWRQRLYTLLNIAGLSIGLTAAMLILLQVAYERSYNAQFVNADRIFLLTRTVYTPGQPLFPVTSNSQRLAPALAPELAEEVEAVVRTGHSVGVVRHDGTPLREIVLLADPGYFDLFERPVVAGDPAEALRQPGFAVLTRSTARKYFGEADPLGQVLDILDEPDLTVAAVVEDLPQNVSIPVGGIVTSFATPFRVVQRLDSWDHNWGNTYLLLKPGVSIDRVLARFPEILPRIVPDYAEPGGERRSFWMRAVALENMYLGPYPDRPTSARDGLNQLSLLAALLLLIAVVNYVNLATARGGLRAREVALRKALGAGRPSLVVQFVLESLLIAGLAGLVSLALVELLQPAFATFVDRPVDPAWGGFGIQLAMLVPLVLVAGLLGGVWPGVVLSSFRAAEVFRGGGKAAVGGGTLRLVLVVGQFSAAIALGIAAWVMWSQFQHATSQRLGFVKEDVVLWRGLEEVRDPARLETLVNRIKAEPAVIDAALAPWVPGDNSDTTWTLRDPSDPAQTARPIRAEPAGFGYLQTMGAQLLAGRLPDPARSDDILFDGPGAQPRQSTNVVVGAETVRHLGWGTPEQALGRQLRAGTGPTAPTLTVIGVIEDFQTSSAQQAPFPTIYPVDHSRFTTLAVRLAAGSGPAEFDRIEAVWREVLPDLPIFRDFLDDNVRAQHTRENLYARLFGLLALLAIAIANLGLFGLAAFTAERRTKEIGVRKVLGADTAQIVRLLVWQFSRPVAYAWIVAAPLAWFGLDAWLSVYANRVELTPWPFLVAGITALAVAWVTVAGHAARVAQAKPVTALRYE